jgi:tetratricopeptide (TPR) repeat protein
MEAYDKALATFTKMMKLDPKCSDGYFNRGALYNKLHQMDKAIKDYDIALELLEPYGPCDYKLKNEVVEEDKSPILLKKAVIYQYTLRYEKAIQSYEAYLNFNTTDADAYDNYGYCLLEADELTEAKNTFERAYELDKKNPDILVGLIAVNYLLDNNPGTQQYKQLLWKLKPKLSKTATVLDELEQEGYNYTPKFRKIFGNCF